MMRQPAAEPDDVYVELVAWLFTANLPTLIMGVTMVGVGTVVATALDDPWVWTVTAASVVLSVAKVWIETAYRRQDPDKRRMRVHVEVWERRFAFATIAFAATVGALAARTFQSHEPVLQMLATGLLFGYCSGNVVRLAVRPRICMVSIAVASVPVAVAAAARGGTEYWMLASVFAVFLPGGIESANRIYREVVQQTALRLAMTTIARYDDLTGLFNRFGLREAFGHLGEQGEQSMVAVHCMDLDRFKPVNDVYGHPCGDALLRMLAARLKAVVRRTDIAARIGGDEFVVVQYPIHHAAEAEMFAHRLIRAITAPYEIGDKTVQIGVSLGFATSPPERMDLAELIATADTALYRMKAEGVAAISNGLRKS